MDFNTFRSKVVILNKIYGGKNFKFKCLSCVEGEKYCGLYINYPIPETRKIEQESSYFGLIRDVNELLDVIVVLYAIYGAYVVNEALYRVYRDENRLFLPYVKLCVSNFIKKNPKPLCPNVRLVLHEMPTLDGFNATKRILVTDKEVFAGRVSELVKEQRNNQPHR